MVNVTNWLEVLYPLQLAIVIELEKNDEAYGVDFKVDRRRSIKRNNSISIINKSKAIGQ